jgi:hypothetical protein
MKQQEYLFELIKSLTKSEKRHFRLFTSFQNGDKSYLQLFDKLEAMAEYDEQKLFFQGNSRNNISVAKSYLNGQILRSLRNYHSSMSVSSKVHSYLRDIEILYQKRLIPQGQKTLKKARSLCLRHELFGLSIVLLNWERRLNQLSDTPTRIESEIYKEQHNLLLQQNEVTELQSLYNQLIEYKQVYGYNRGEEGEKLESIIASAVLESPEPLLSVRARYYYYVIASNYYYLVGRFEDGYKASTAQVGLDLSAQEDFEYLNGTLEHTSSCMFYNNKNGEALHYLTQVQTIIDTLPIGKYEQVRIRVFYFRSNYELMIFMNVADEVKIRKKLLEVEAGLAEFKGRLKKEMEFVIYSSIAYAYFILGELKLSKAWNNKILNTPKKQVRSDIYHGARIVQLFILADLEQYDVLSYELNSAYRYFHAHHKKGNQYGLEMLAIEQLRKLTNLTSKSEIPRLAENYRVKMEDLLSREAVHSHEEIELELYWIQSRIEGVSFLTVKKRHAVPLDVFPAK